MIITIKQMHETIDYNMYNLETYYVIITKFDA